MIVDDPFKVIAFFTACVVLVIVKYGDDTKFRTTVCYDIYKYYNNNT